MSVAEREAIHTLEAILHTQLPIVEHTTDTHGATEMVFALFDLLGLRFIPRLRDAGDLLLHLLGPPTGLAVDAVMRSRARPQRILEHYADLLRTAASLKRGWVPASLLITRLKNATPQSPVAAALSEYGRIVRTNFLLVYCADPAERARIAGQLNKGETLHAPPRSTLQWLRKNTGRSGTTTGPSRRRRTRERDCACGAPGAGASARRASPRACCGSCWCAVPVGPIVRAVSERESLLGTVGQTRRVLGGVVLDRPRGHRVDAVVQRVGDEANSQLAERSGRDLALRPPYA